MYTALIFRYFLLLYSLRDSEVENRKQCQEKFCKQAVREKTSLLFPIFVDLKKCFLLSVKEKSFL